MGNEPEKNSSEPLLDYERVPDAGRRRRGPVRLALGIVGGMIAFIFTLFLAGALVETMNPSDGDAGIILMFAAGAIACLAALLVFWAIVKEPLG